MKIFCVGMNYARHNDELHHSIGEVQGIDSAPTIFLKPDTALCRSDWPVYVPDFTQEFEYETELVVRINRLGKAYPNALPIATTTRSPWGSTSRAATCSGSSRPKGCPGR